VEDVSGLTAISEGEESQAYRFQSGTRAYIARVNKDVEGFEKDAFAYRRFSRSNLPIPEVIHIGQIDHHFFCISEAMRGVTLQDLNPRGLPVLLDPTARVWGAISESELGEMRGFGPFDPSGHGKYESWRDFLISIGDEQRYDWPAIGHMVPYDEISRLLEHLRRLVEQCPEMRALVHGDFGSNNLLTDGRQITGVIDWSEAAIGDPLYDVANIFFWRTWLECMGQQASYFELQLGDSTAHGDRLLCYQLRIGLAEIYAHAIEDNRAVLSWALARCRYLISRLSS
jgi:hygromycin-B 4-O-kinase